VSEDRPSSFFSQVVIPPLSAPELLPSATLVVPLAPVRLIVSSRFFGSSSGDGYRDAFAPPPLSRACELGEKIRSSLPFLQNSKPFQQYYRRARELREGHSVKWNDELLSDSLEASKMTVSFVNKDTVAKPLVKKGLLRKGFLNPRPTVLVPPALSREVNDVGVVGPPSPSSGCLIPSSVNGNGFS
jgi:hypothetical protein